jgi:2-polyprenyl-6-methoxyphenol hydroxylase-like FAD-dependent oxidoreductase
MTGALGKRAIVVGAGIGGLSTAGALSDYFEQVEIFELDRLSTFVGSRLGTPQDRHPHALLAGLRALGALFPAFEDDLAKAGAVSVGMSRDVHFERPDVGLLPKRDLSIALLCASRPLIEFMLRNRGAASPNIAFRSHSRVTEIAPAQGAAGVDGIRFDAGSGKLETLEAELVVDASGRGTLTLALLDALGWQHSWDPFVGASRSLITPHVIAASPFPDSAS